MARLDMMRVFPVLLLCLCVTSATKTCSNCEEDCPGHASGGVNEYAVKFLGRVYDPPTDMTTFKWEVFVDGDCCCNDNPCPLEYQHTRRLSTHNDKPRALQSNGVAGSGCHDLDIWVIALHSSCTMDDIVGGQFGGATPGPGAEGGYIPNYFEDGAVFMWANGQVKGMEPFTYSSVDYTLVMHGNIGAGAAMSGFADEGVTRFDIVYSMGPVCNVHPPIIVDDESSNSVDIDVADTDPPPVAEELGGSIYGKVVGVCKTSKHPAKGVNVLVQNVTSQQVIADTYTNKYGSFRVLDLPAGDYKVLVIAPEGDRVLSDNPVNVTVQDEHVTVKFFLQQCQIKSVPQTQYPQMSGGGYWQAEIPQNWDYKFDEKVYWWEIFPKHFPKHHLESESEPETGPESESDSESKFWDLREGIDWKVDEWWEEEWWGEW